MPALGSAVVWDDRDSRMELGQKVLAACVCLTNRGRCAACLGSGTLRTGLRI